MRRTIKERARELTKSMWRRSQNTSFSVQWSGKALRSWRWARVWRMKTWEEQGKCYHVLRVSEGSRGWTKRKTVYLDTGNPSAPEAYRQPLDTPRVSHYGEMLSFPPAGRVLRTEEPHTVLPFLQNVSKPYSPAFQAQIPTQWGEPVHNKKCSMWKVNH